jgi:NADH-quinone oxidoreductase subunit H
MTAFFQTDLGIVILTLLESLALIVPLLIGVAYLTYFERRVMGAIQLRKGPNIVGPFGLWQPFADAIKMLFKETIIPADSDRLLFIMAPMITFGLAVAAWAVIPVNNHWAVANINVGTMYLFAISSLGVYGIIIAGWASNSKYAFLGALRSAAQMVSYEVSMGFIIVTVLVCVGSRRSAIFGLPSRFFRSSSSSSSLAWLRPIARRSIWRRGSPKSLLASSSNIAPCPSPCSSWVNTRT